MKSVAGMLSQDEAPGKNPAFDLLRNLRQNLALIVLLFALIMGAIVTGVYVRKPAYESTAKILISFQSLGISLSRAEFQYGNTPVQSAEAITSQGEILKSRDLMEQVIDETGVEALRSPGPTGMIGRIVGGAANFAGSIIESALVQLGLATKKSERDVLIERLADALTVYPVRQSQVMVVTVRWNRPEIARQLLSKVMEIYFARNKVINQDMSSYEVFAEQTKRLSAELSNAELELLRFKLEKERLDFPEEKQRLWSRIGKLSELLQGITLVSGNDRAGSSKPALAGEENNIAAAEVSSLQSQLSSFKLDLARLRISSAPDNRVVREMESQISETERMISAILSRVAQALEKSRARLRAVNEAEASFERISRNVEMARDAYQTYRKVTEDRRLMQARNMPVNFQVIDNPSLPLQPIGPARLTLLIAGLPFSLICAIGLMLLIHFYRRWTQRLTNATPETPVPADQAV